MSAYLIANVDVHDPDGLRSVSQPHRRHRRAAWWRFIVRGGTVHQLEGEPWAHRLVIIQFPDLAAAQGFYDSPEYQEVIPLRTLVSDGALLIVEGAD